MKFRMKSTVREVKSYSSLVTLCQKEIDTRQKRRGEVIKEKFNAWKFQIKKAQQILEESELKRLSYSRGSEASLCL